MRPDRAIVKKALVDAGGDKTKAAALLGCSRPTLYTWIYQHGLERLAGICNDRRTELDMKERKDTGLRRQGSPKESIPAVKPPGAEPNSLRLVPQQAAVEMPVNATVLLPKSLWKAVRKTAIDRECTVSTFVEEALRAAMDEPKRKAARGKDSE